MVPWKRSRLSLVAIGIEVGASNFRFESVSENICDLARRDLSILLERFTAAGGVVVELKFAFCEHLFVAARSWP